MSPDDIFASQLWLWPDPAVKRDASGRVLFVNAAFLQLYGGQAQDWHGNAVGGWPAPQGPGQSYRFETRIPAQAGMVDEQIYDWIEMSLQDGAALALARNVTIFTVSPDPMPGNIAPEPEQSFQNVAANAVVDIPSVQPVLETAQAYVPLMESPAEPMTAAPAALPVEDSYQPEFTSPEMALDTLETPDTQITMESVAAPEETYAAIETASPDLYDSEPEEEPARDYERRALPIESDSSILGNNWRDAVIAKAIGADAPNGDASEATMSDPDADSSEGHTLSESGNAQEGIRILLAEDNAINALLTRTLLEADGHTVETVEDGQLAVEAMKTAAFDLIFMDMRMPNMDGLEATRKIRSLANVSSNLPIIALTANAFDDDRNACFDSGMNDFMTKPVSAEELTDMVKNWTSGEKQKLAS